MKGCYSHRTPCIRREVMSKGYGLLMLFANKGKVMVLLIMKGCCGGMQRENGTIGISHVGEPPYGMLGRRFNQEELVFLF